MHDICDALQYTQMHTFSCYTQQQTLSLLYINTIDDNYSLSNLMRPVTKGFKYPNLSIDVQLLYRNKTKKYIVNTLQYPTTRHSTHTALSNK